MCAEIYVFSQSNHTSAEKYLDKWIYYAVRNVDLARKKNRYKSHRIEFAFTREKEIEQNRCTVEGVECRRNKNKKNFSIQSQTNHGYLFGYTNERKQ